ncbi:hypothetical protein HF521_021720 [Silurus meridionalis]|uniref:Ig-like domain-containing protein n=1 Tax=Silurus meridionalis TaxID=175797 RepID=A0A8T0BBY3_SILME|nr:hypothetical protein HF521_021720 [Silurus meridionalis]
MAHLYAILYFVTFKWVYINCQQIIQVQQEPQDLVLFAGLSVRVSCSVTGLSNPDLYWYRWNETEGFTLVFTSRGTGMMDPASSGQFKSSRPNDLQMFLESDAVSENGSAVCTVAFHCRSAAHTSPSGTKGPGSFLWIIVEDIVLYNWN